MPESSDNSKVSKEDRRGTSNSTYVVVMLMSGKNCPKLVHLQDPAQIVVNQDSGEMIAPFWAHKVGLSLKFFLHMDVSQILWTWQLTTDTAWVLLLPLPQWSHQNVRSLGKLPG